MPTCIVYFPSIQNKKHSKVLMGLKQIRSAFAPKNAKKFYHSIATLNSAKVLLVKPVNERTFIKPSCLSSSHSCLPACLPACFSFFYSSLPACFSFLYSCLPGGLLVPPSSQSSLPACLLVPASSHSLLPGCLHVPPSSHSRQPTCLTRSLGRHSSNFFLLVCLFRLM